MSPAKNQLPSSILLALGLGAGCQRCGEPTHMGPCLSIAPPEDPPPPPPAEPRVGPCLSEDPHVGPCLEYAEPPPPPPPPPAEPPLHVCLSVAPPEQPEDPPPPPPPPPEEDEGASGALHRVLERGVLPEDVAALLRQRTRPTG